MFGFKKLKRYLRDPKFALGCDLIQKHPNWMSDKFYIETQWRLNMDYPLNLDKPQTACEKYQWLKLHDHNPLYHRLVDKYEVKKWVADRIGEEHIVKTYALYNSVDEIDFDALPSSFVLKCTHNSGGLVVCPDKSKLDRDEAIKTIKEGLSVSDYYLTNREWAYKGVKPRIIAEEYIPILGKADSVEYKLFCLDGKVCLTTVCSGIAHVEYDKRFNDHFDKDGKRLPFYVNYKPAGLELPETSIYKELVRIAEILSQNIPHVRVDLYVYNNVIMFGEMTFYTWAGYMDFVPKEYDRILGTWCELNQKHK
jgi:hypothetical protein